MLVGRLEGLNVTALPLVLESQLRVLGIYVLKTRSSASSAIASRASMGKALNAPRNARLSKR
jgi:hypothetical protein